jgi:hypothetical protein
MTMVNCNNKQGSIATRRFMTTLRCDLSNVTNNLRCNTPEPSKAYMIRYNHKSSITAMWQNLSSLLIALVNASHVKSKS